LARRSCRYAQRTGSNVFDAAALPAQPRYADRRRRRHSRSPRVWRADITNSISPRHFRFDRRRPDSTERTYGAAAQNVSYSGGNAILDFGNGELLHCSMSRRRNKNRLVARNSLPATMAVTTAAATTAAGRQSTMPTIPYYTGRRPARPVISVVDTTGTLPASTLDILGADRDALTISGNRRHITDTTAAHPYILTAMRLTLKEGPAVRYPTLDDFNAALQLIQFSQAPPTALAGDVGAHERQYHPTVTTTI